MLAKMWKTGNFFHCWCGGVYTEAVTLEDSLAVSHKTNFNVAIWFSNYGSSHTKSSQGLISSITQNCQNVEATEMSFRRNAGIVVLSDNVMSKKKASSKPWKDRRNLKVTEANLPAKLTYCMILTIRYSGNTKTMKIVKRSVIAKGLQQGEFLKVNSIQRTRIPFEVGDCCQNCPHLNSLENSLPGKARFWSTYFTK